MSVRLAPGLRQEMLAHAEREMPLEACGLLGGRDSEFVLFLPCRNVLQSPTRYAIGAEEILAAQRRFAKEGLQLAGIFHSHPAGPAQPSQIDLREASYPDAIYLIAAPGAQELRAFRLEDEAMREVAVED